MRGGRLRGTSRHQRIVFYSETAPQSNDIIGGPNNDCDIQKQLAHRSTTSSRQSMMTLKTWLQDCERSHTTCDSAMVKDAYIPPHPRHAEKISSGPKKSLGKTGKKESLTGISNGGILL